jgi:hypothetical protein
LAQTLQACEAAAQALDTVTELAPDFVRLHERARQFAQTLTHFSQAGPTEAVRWLEVGLQAKLVESPLDIAQAVGERLLGPAQGGKTWVFTSATLGDDERLSWFTEPCGLQDAQVLRIGSPFDYPTQAALYVPPQMPKPSDPSHSQRVAQAAGDWAQRLGGRTLVLTTTLRALRAIAELMQARFGPGGALEVLVQGQGPKRALIERFRRASSLGEPGCVLVASASFWEGIDVAGDALQLVIIDKLPFAPPGDPLAEARSRHLQSQGRNPFNDYFVPEAAVALKQGAGRLIRRETDQGVLVVCDTRLTQMGYGRRLLRALPPMQRLQTAQEPALGVAALQHAQRVVAQLGHAQRVIGAVEQVHGLFGGGYVAEFIDGRLRPVDCGHIGAAGQIKTRHVDFGLGQRVHHVTHAQARIRRVFGIGIARDQFSKRRKGVLGRLLVALRQIAPRQPPEQAEVFIEVGQALEVERVVQRRTGRMQAHEAVQGGHGLRRFVVAVVGMGFFQLRLLRQRRACCPAFELFIQRDGLVEGTVGSFVARFGVNLVGTPAGRRVRSLASAAHQQGQGGDSREKADAGCGR